MKNALSKIPVNQLFIIGLFATLITAFFSEGFYHVDEHYQILEFAGAKLGFNNEYQLSWEYHEKMRPTLQPTIVYLLYKFLAWFGWNNPFAIATILRLITALGSFFVVKYLYDSFSNIWTTENEKRIFLLGSFFLWFAMYNHVRFSSETWSAFFLFIGVAMIHKWSKMNFSQAFFIGVVLGISFLFRFQIAFSFIGIGLFLIFRIRLKWNLILLSVLGFLFVLGIGFLIDSWFYDAWVFTPWNYYYQNIVMEKASGFGESPWYFYLTSFINDSFLPFGIILLLGLLLFFRNWKDNIFLYLFIPFFVAHCVIGHKELRFLFPMIFILPFGIVSMYNFLKGYEWSQTRWFKFLTGVLLVINFSLLLYVMFAPATSLIRTYRGFYNAKIDNVIMVHYSSEYNYKIHPLYFYYRRGINEKELSEIDTIDKNGEEYYVFLEDKDCVGNEHLLGKRISQNIPEWLYIFNINDWLSRENHYYIYKMKD